MAHLYPLTHKAASSPLVGTIHYSSPIRECLLDQLGVFDVVALWLACDFKESRRDFERYILHVEHGAAPDVYDMEPYTRSMYADRERKKYAPKNPSTTISSDTWTSSADFVNHYIKSRERVSRVQDPTSLGSAALHQLVYKKLPASVLVEGSSLPWPPRSVHSLPWGPRSLYYDSDEDCEGQEKVSCTIHDALELCLDEAPGARDEKDEEPFSKYPEAQTIACLRIESYSECTENGPDGIASAAVVNLSLITKDTLRHWVYERGAAQWTRFLHRIQEVWEETKCGEFEEMCDSEYAIYASSGSDATITESNWFVLGPASNEWLLQLPTGPRVAVRKKEAFHWKPTVRVGGAIQPNHKATALPLSAVLHREEGQRHEELQTLLKWF